MAGSTTSIGCGMAGTLSVTCSATCTVPASCPVDVMLLIDRTGSHNTLMNANRAAAESQLIAPLLAAGDVRVGLSYFADFPVDPHGSAGDVPFGSSVAPTTDMTAIASGLAALPSLAGGDGPESGVEALNVLAGAPPHMSSLPFTCAAGLDPGGCWRPEALRAVVIISDISQHNAPSNAIMGLVSPYPAGVGSPDWDTVRPRMMTQRIALFALVRDRGVSEDDAASQMNLLTTQLGQDPTATVVTHALVSTGDLTTQLGQTRDRIIAFYGL